MTKPSEPSQLGTLQLYILSILWNQEMYGLEIVKHLRIRRYSIGTNQLYPALKRLESMSALTSRKQIRVGTTRIYYKITSYGKQIMGQQFIHLLDLFQDIMLEKVSIIGKICADFLKIQPGMRILDISKDFYETFILTIVPKLLPNGGYYIFTTSKDFQEIYQERIEFNKYERTVTPVLPSGNKINLQDHSMDGIVSFFFFRNVSSLPFLAEIARLLKPDAKAIIIDWAFVKNDIRHSMVKSILPEYQFFYPNDLMNEANKLGFLSHLHHKQEGVIIIELEYKP